MKTQFIYETAISIIGIIAVLLFGPKGGAILALLVLILFIGKKKFDDEDKVLFRKVNMYTLIPFCIILALILVFLNRQINGYIVKDLWVYLVGFLFCLAHGVTGLIVFRNKK
jgi:hypothetical protein